MRLPLRPILSSLGHHRLTAGLLALQVALTCAFVTNAMYLITDRIDRLHAPSGLPEDQVSLLTVRDLQKDANRQMQLQTDLMALRAIAGVTAAAAIGPILPLSSGAADSSTCADQRALERAVALRSNGVAGCVKVSFYTGSPGFVQAMGAQLIAGRDFHPDDYSTDTPTAIIITRTLARQLWPNESVVGRTLYGWDSKRIVVGVIEDLLRPRLRSAALDHLVTLSPQLPIEAKTHYLLRSAPQDRGRVLHEAAALLPTLGSSRLVATDQQLRFTQVRNRYFQRDTTMIGLFIAATSGLLFVTALGIGGLANFWVQQRTCHIGIRRAIGATRRDILRYFQAENLLIVGSGSVLGMVLALLLNQWLMLRYEVPGLPIIYVPAGASALLLLGQCAVFWPAQRAAVIPPATATRRS
ncbi:FtsX-like permease family protein [Xanthomonas oryzae pv. oryzicola]|uniref:ABC transporter permease n=1 Tax=Xanthomonas oryzae TaxID=347 RepID=UPI000642C981|nr:FtsX-like permease family protein [Xanthomonas oryzae]AKN99700.1 ABC transporter permease [Xanthomonas oryzae pv. oryzicola]KOR51922.1 ABC transporter permease [Xanthomonas oryzae]OLK91631.1 ABC transporter permease [Xanthomonas oryzae pv. oryzicola]ULX25117.1 FtsX-like permease family protein [Xanthomonas oryzae pv. oryzicola]UNW43175.1 FtsX-like permease family protein [Xanthomonas oryzae pv. oryzicola]